MAGSRQADLQDLHLHAASGKVPPQWGPDTDQTYPLRTYIRDLRLWSYAADVDQVRLAPLACLRLTGQAKELVRELDPQVLAQGRQLQNGNFQSGLEFLIATLEARYGVLQQELQIFVLRELLQFHRRGSESIDEALSRFGILTTRHMRVRESHLTSLFSHGFCSMVLGFRPRNGPRCSSTQPEHFQSI